MRLSKILEGRSISSTRSKKVWSALTEPEKLARWLAEAVVNLEKGGRFELVFSGTEGNSVVCHITEVEHLSVFEFT